jgi:hypothetical protein
MLKKPPSPIVLLLTLLALLTASHAMAKNHSYLHVAPEVRGSGSGADADNASAYLEPQFWDAVRDRLEQQSVTVRFATGEYSTGTLTLTTFGHPDHALILEGDKDGGTIFTGNVHRHIQIRGGQNMTLRYLNFTGETQNFAMHIVGYPEFNPVENLVVEHCRFEDLSIADRGGIGIAGRVTELTVRECHFERVGESAHAHMIYCTSTGPGTLRFHNNHFIDTPGDYLRLRNRGAYAEIIGNTFISNSNRDNRPFVALIAFGTETRGEAIGDNVLIEGNRFRYHPVPTWSWDRGIAICLSAYGWDPQGDTRYMLSPAEARTLAEGSPTRRRALLNDVMQINPDTLVIKNNVFENIRYQIGFGSRAAEGQGQGWIGFVDLTRIVNASGNRSN